MDERYLKLQESAGYIKDRIGSRIPEVGIVLGSGLGKLADTIADSIVIPYCDIPNFPLSTAIGHKGNLISGYLSGKCVIAMQGRFHYYEGHSMDKVVVGPRVMKLLGAEYFFASNAAGAANPDFKVGDLVMIKDHISMFPNPLVGPNIPELGVRFQDMTCAYDSSLRSIAAQSASELGISLKEGIYLGGTGPTYETPAEVRFYRMIGADLLGMSTIPEVIAARHCGLRVFGVSVVTNVCNTGNVENNLNDGDDVVRQADAAADRMSELFRSILEKI